MDELYCDVIGCMSRANWERMSLADADLHDYLCRAHHDLLQSFSKSAAAGYKPIVGERSGTGKTSPQRGAASGDAAQFMGRRNHRPGGFGRRVAVDLAGSHTTG